MNTPLIKTDRLILRKFTAKDASAFLKIMSGKSQHLSSPISADNDQGVRGISA